MKAEPTTPLAGSIVTYDVAAALDLTTASTELFALAATIAGGLMSPALIPEAKILSERVHAALEVFRGAHQRGGVPL